MRALPRGAAFGITAAMFTAVSLQAQRPPDQGEPLSLNDAVTLALARNPDLLNVRRGVDQATLSLRVAESAFSVQVIPSMAGALGLSVLPNQSYGVGVSKKFQTGTTVSGLVASTSYQNQFGAYFNADTTLQVTQPLLRGYGRAIVSRAVSDAAGRVAVARAEAAFAEQQLGVQVASAYYAIVVQARVAGVARSALERAEALRDASAALLSTGRVSQLDVLRADQLASQTRARVLEADDALADARDRLCLLIGRSINEPVRVRENIPTDTGPVPDLAVSEQTAARTRPEVISAQNAITEQDRAIAVARSQLRPQLDVGFALTRRETAPTLASSFGLDGFGPTTFVNVSMPLERTPEEVALQTALTERENRVRAFETSRDRVQLEVRQAARRWARATATLALAKNNTALAETEMEVATFRFQRGLSNNLDLISAQTTYREAQAQEVSAQADAVIAAIAFRAAAGVLDPRQDLK